MSTRHGHRSQPRRRHVRHAAQVLRDRPSLHVPQRDLYKPNPDASPV